MLYYLCKVFFSKYSLSSQMLIQLFRNWQTRCKNENELYYARHVYFLMVAYYDLSLLYLRQINSRDKATVQQNENLLYQYLNSWSGLIKHKPCDSSHAQSAVCRSEESVTLFKTPWKFILHFYFLTGLFSKNIGL